MYRDTSIILPSAQFDRLDTEMGIDFDIPISQVWAANLQLIFVNHSEFFSG